MQCNDEPCRWQEARSIHIGVDAPDAAQLGQRLPRLLSAERDAETMRRVADALGAASRLLKGEDATLRVVVDAIASAVSRLAPGDLLLVSFAGHGAQVAGSATEPDALDEAWCLYDDVLLDDELSDLIADAPAGSDVVVVTDACFAAGMLDRGAGGPPTLVPKAPSGRKTLNIDPILLRDVGGSSTLSFRGATTIPSRRFGRIRSPRFTSDRVRRGQGARPIQARVVALGAVGENEQAIEGAEGGLFTAALVEALRRIGDGAVTYEELASMIAELLGSERRLVDVGGAATSLTLQETAFKGLAEPRRNTDGLGRLAAPRRPAGNS